MLLTGYSTGWPTALMAVGEAWQDAGLNSNKTRISHPGFDPKARYRNSLHPQIRVGYKFQRSSESKGGQMVREGKL